jgi:hypothetical protein
MKTENKMKDNSAILTIADVGYRVGDTTILKTSVLPSHLGSFV